MKKAARNVMRQITRNYFFISDQKWGAVNPPSPHSPSPDVYGSELEHVMAETYSHIWTYAAPCLEKKYQRTVEK